MEFVKEILYCDHLKIHALEHAGELSCTCVEFVCRNLSRSVVFNFIDSTCCVSFLVRGFPKARSLLDFPKSSDRDGISRTAHSLITQLDRWTVFGTAGSTFDRNV